MAERPIIMSAPMVRALLAGRKTQTRRALKPQPWAEAEMSQQCRQSPEGWQVGGDSGIWHDESGDIFENWRCPYGVPGDVLWVRETWGTMDHLNGSSPSQIGRANEPNLSSIPLYYRADESRRPDFAWQPTRLRSPIHMPRWASRITLKITDVRVERLNDISEADAQAEGVRRIGQEYASFNDPKSSWHDGPNLWTVDSAWRVSLSAPTSAGAYRMLWESLNGEGSWEANPWTWALTFERLDV